MYKFDHNQESVVASNTEYLEAHLLKFKSLAQLLNDLGSRQSIALRLDFDESRSVENNCLFSEAYKFFTFPKVAQRMVAFNLSACMSHFRASYILRISKAICTQRNSLQHISIAMPSEFWKKALLAQFLMHFASKDVENSLIQTLQDITIDRIFTAEEMIIIGRISRRFDSWTVNNVHCDKKFIENGLSGVKFRIQKRIEWSLAANSVKVSVRNMLSTIERNSFQQLSFSTDVIVANDPKLSWYQHSFNRDKHVLFGGQGLSIFHAFPTSSDLFRMHSDRFRVRSKRRKNNSSSKSGGSFDI